MKDDEGVTKKLPTSSLSALDEGLKWGDGRKTVAHEAELFHTKLT